MPGARAGQAEVGEAVFGCDEASAAEKNARRSDKGFKLAMISARKAGTENFVVGVVTTPCTERPKYMPHRGLPLRSNSSPAAQCAEYGTALGRF